MTWIVFIVRALVSLGVIAGALVAVRPKLPRTAYSLAAAAAIDLLASCCARGIYSGIDPETMGYDVVSSVYLGAACMDGFQGFLVGVLVLAAVALMAREGKPAAPPPGQTPPGQTPPPGF